MTDEDSAVFALASDEFHVRFLQLQYGSNTMFEMLLVWEFGFQLQFGSGSVLDGWGIDIWVSLQSTSVSFVVGSRLMFRIVSVQIGVHRRHRRSRTEITAGIVHLVSVYRFASVGLILFHI
ncbi:hypothetical protein HanPI659440_Chr00c21g0734961 [Helianthus annuus]|nr:hypothetical protein HanPI659440_Chr00c21g0734951 [Helianthus annuus]KAJ0816056.1 hypothetical protein HanPI659440_Chr00c21g0734961 [Helianthus annuus]